MAFLRQLIDNIKMSLRSAHKGYNYQDLTSAFLVCRALCLFDRFNIWVDEKESKSDSLDDLKILVPSVAKYCFQIKHSSNKSLAAQDFQKDGQLSLKKLLEYDESDKSGDKKEYYFILKWSYKEGELPLIRDESALLIGFHFSSYRFNDKKLVDLSRALNLDEQSFKKLVPLFPRIHIVANAPDFNGDFTNPGELEAEMLEQLRFLGLNKFPNNIRKLEDIATSLVSKLCLLRGAAKYSIDSGSFLKAVGIQTDLGKLPEIFDIDRLHFLHRENVCEELADVVKKNNKTICLGEPGSGKSYLIDEFTQYLESIGIQSSKHLMFAGTSDKDAPLRIDPNYLISNIYIGLNEAAKSDVPATKVFGTDIKSLNKLISEIKKPTLLIIDGIDHAYRGSLNKEDLKRLEQTIDQIECNQNVHLLIVSQEIAFLNAKRGFAYYQLPAWNETDIQKLSLLYGLSLDNVDLTKISEKSSGNPLYLTYILKSFDSDGLDTLPAYNGNIKTYYEYLLESSSDTFLFQYLGTIQFEFSVDDFSGITNMGMVAARFLQAYRHILKYSSIDEAFTIYHESFRRFIIERSKAEGIDLRKCYLDIAVWLENQGFFDDDRSYNFLLDSYIRADENEKCLSHCDFDFLIKSVSKGHPIERIKDNLCAFKKASCRSGSYEKYMVVALLNETLASSEEGPFLVPDSDAFIDSFLKLHGERGATLLLDRFQDGARQNLIRYYAYKNGIDLGNIEIKEANYNSYERDMRPCLMVAQKLSEKDGTIRLSPDLTLRSCFDIYESFLELDSAARIEGGDNDYVKMLINASDLENTYPGLIISFDMTNREKVEMISNQAMFLLQFISFSEAMNPSFEEWIAIANRCHYDFLFMLCQLILANRAAYTRLKIDKNLDDFESSVIENISRFKNGTHPFTGKPRACDFSDKMFKTIFVRQLFIPLRYIKKRASEYFKVIVEISDRLSTEFIGSKLGCISLEDVLKETPNYLNDQNASAILNVCKEAVVSSSKYEKYVYLAEQYFVLSNLALPHDETLGKHFFEEGIRCSLCYGYHKDPMIYDLVDAMRNYPDEGAKTHDNFVVFFNMADSLYYRTDGRGVSTSYQNAFRVFSERFPKAAVGYANYARRTMKPDAAGEYACMAIEENFANIDLCTLVDLLIKYDLYFEDRNFYFSAMDLMMDKGDKQSAKRVLELLISHSESLESSKNKVAKINALIKALDIKAKPIIYKPIETVSNSDTLHHSAHLNTLTPQKLASGEISFEAYTTNSIIDSLCKIDLGKEHKEILIKIFADNRWSYRKMIQIATGLQQRKLDVLRECFFCALLFAVSNDGWSKRFTHLEYLVRGMKLNASQCEKDLFLVLERVEMPTYGYSGLIAPLRVCGFKDRADALSKIVFDYSKIRIPNPNTTMISDVFNNNFKTVSEAFGSLLEDN